VNYRHAFHAGNFADVVKHVVVARILTHLRDKPAAFRVIDTHAGAGVYNLASGEARRSGEWRDGIARVRDATFAPAVAALLKPYFEVIDALNGADELRLYPGSPAIARAWLRPNDRLLACELHPDAAISLRQNLRGDPRIKVLEIDGWTALGAYVPPVERRGLVLVDPPFEHEAEFTRLAKGLENAHRKWPTGIYALWYPIKGRPAPDNLAKSVRRFGIAKVLRTELTVAPLSDPSRLNGSGLLIVNPPWKLEAELSLLFPALAKVLGRDGKGSSRIDWLTGEA